jgi:flagellar motor switch protein FliM
MLDAGVQSDRTDVDERWINALREEIKEAQIEMSSTLTETDLTLREVLNLKAGDVIPIEVPGVVTLRAENIPVFRGRFGVAQGNSAIKITDRIRHRL